ncbi:MAG: hypothetical protein U5L09_09100 [Bacteroidales bacterium]|nr:hypothetical protein [Bacteroidales bacterium]
MLKKDMGLQEKMFTEVEAWRSSGIAKQEFIKDKEYSLSKFNYWVAKYRAAQVDDQAEGFREVDFTETKLGKVLEIEAPSGVKIMVYA